MGTGAGGVAYSREIERGRKIKYQARARKHGSLGMEIGMECRLMADFSFISEACWLMLEHEGASWERVAALLHCCFMSSVLIGCRRSAVCWFS